MASEQRVDERALAQTSLSHDHDVQGEASLEQLGFDLRGDGVEPLS